MLDRKVTHRLIGAGIVIVAAAIILPQILDGERPPELDVQVEVAKAPVFPEVKIAAAKSLDQLPVSTSDVPAPVAKSAEPEKSPQDISLVPVTKDSTPAPTQAEKKDVAKEAPAPKATPAATEPPADRWTVQIATFAQEANAKRLVDKLKKANYPAYSITTNSLFKVFVGPELERSTSDNVRSDIQKKFSLKGIVVKFSEN